MRNKRSKNTEFTPRDYWQKKLNINFTDESLRYFKLCRKLSKSETRKFKGTSFKTFNDWNEYITKIIENLDILELKEFSKYLNYETRTNFSIGKTMSNFFWPFIVAVFVGLITHNITEPLFKYNQNIYQILLSIVNIIFMLFMPTILLIYILKSYNNLETKKLFFEDIKAIVDKRILDLEESPTDM